MSLFARLVLGALCTVGIALLAWNSADHPWIQATVGYQVLAAFVSFNTLVFASMAAFKTGYLGGRATGRSQS